MKKYLLVAMTLVSTLANADVLKIKNSELGCTRYIVPENPEASVQLQNEGAEVESKKVTYGFALENLRIDFDKKEVLMDVRQKVVMGFNRTLIHDIRVAKSQEEIYKYTNQLNFDIRLFHEICISDSNELISAE